MKCCHCNLSRICKILVLVQSSRPEIDIDVKNCKYYQDDPNGRQEDPFPILDTIENKFIDTDIDIKEGFNKLVSSEESFAETNKFAIVHKKVEDNDEEKTVKCVDCDDESATTVCSVCGISLCGSCVIEDVKSKKEYCEKCWNKIV